MSDKPISVGDLVQVVKPRECCGNPSGLGVIFVVTSFEDWALCEKCGMDKGLFAARHDGGRARPDRLRRIPPLADLQGDDVSQSLRIKVPV